MALQPDKLKFGEFWGYPKNTTVWPSLVTQRHAGTAIICWLVRFYDQDNRLHYDATRGGVAGVARKPQYCFGFLSETM